MGRELGLFSPAATNTLVATAMVSIVLNPLLYRTAAPIERWARRHPAVWRFLNRARSGLPAQGDRTATARGPSPSHRALVVGYGPTGRTVARMLRENAIAPTILEMNVDTVRQLREQGVDAVYGDATLSATLTAAGAATAGSLILTSAGMAHSSETIRAARALNPKIRVLARTSYLRDLPALGAAGADAVYSGEGEVALAFVEDILETLGATPDQIDRERDRAHRELSGADSLT
jgi:CPA2 family monovalent cation:H+ antiporter-2